jgi:hypothetical protein
MVHTFTVYATIFLFELYVSTLKGAFNYISLGIELQRNARTLTLTYTGHNQPLSFFLYTFGDVTQ